MIASEFSSFSRKERRPLRQRRAYQCPRCAIDGQRRGSECSYGPLNWNAEDDRHRSSSNAGDICRTITGASRKL